MRKDKSLKMIFSSSMLFFWDVNQNITFIQKNWKCLRFKFASYDQVNPAVTGLSAASRSCGSPRWISLFCLMATGFIFSFHQWNHHCQHRLRHKAIISNSTVQRNTYIHWTSMQNHCATSTKILKQCQQHRCTERSTFVHLSLINSKSSAADTHTHASSVLHSLYTTRQWLTIQCNAVLETIFKQQVNHSFFILDNYKHPQQNVKKDLWLKM